MIISRQIDSICILTFDAANGNMISLEDIEKLLSYIDIIENDVAIRGVIFTGHGRSFCTGLNTSQLFNQFSEQQTNHFFKTFDLLLLRLFSFPKPIVAAVNGHSIGGGLLIQCCADVSLIADDDNIKLGLPELKLGLTIDELMKFLLRYTLDEKKCSKLLYSSEYINMTMSLNLGLVDGIVAREKLLDESVLYIQRLVDYNEKAFSATKKNLRIECVEKMREALSKKCYCVLTELLSEKYS